MKKIKQKVSIEHEYHTTKSDIIVYSLTDLATLMGTTSISANLHLYNIKKQKCEGRQCWIVPKSVVEQQINKIEHNIKDWLQRVTTMKQIYKRCK